MRQRRAFTRLKRRLNCDIRIHGCEYLGVVRDLSPGGFFIQTSVAPAVGSEVWVTLRQQEGPGIPLVAKVTNRRRVPRRLSAFESGGLGCCLETPPPEEYFQLLGKLEG